MSRYLLDTGVLNAFLRGRHGAVALIDPWLATGDICTSILVYGEIVEFLQGLPPPDFARREAELRELLRDVHPLPPAPVHPRQHPSVHTPQPSRSPGQTHQNAHPL